MKLSDVVMPPVTDYVNVGDLVWWAECYPISNNDLEKKEEKK